MRGRRRCELRSARRASASAASSRRISRCTTVTCHLFNTVLASHIAPRSRTALQWWRTSKRVADCNRLYGTALACVMSTHIASLFLLELLCVPLLTPGVCHISWPPASHPCISVRHCASLPFAQTVYASIAIGNGSKHGQLHLCHARLSLTTASKHFLYGPHLRHEPCISNCEVKFALSTQVMETTCG